MSEASRGWGPLRGGERRCRSQMEEESLWNGGGMLGGCEKAVSCLTGPSASKRVFQSTEGLQAEGKKAVSPWVKAGEWFQISQWRTYKSPVTLSISGSSEDKSSSHVLFLGVSSFLFFIMLLIIPFIFLSFLFFSGMALLSFSILALSSRCFVYIYFILSLSVIMTAATWWSILLTLCYKQNRYETSSLGTRRGKCGVVWGWLLHWNTQTLLHGRSCCEAEIPVVCSLLVISQFFQAGIQKGSSEPQIKAAPVIRLPCQALKMRQVRDRSLFYLRSAIVFLYNP